MSPPKSCRRSISAAAKARRTATNDHDSSVETGRCLDAWLRLVMLVPNEETSAFVVHLPDRKRRQCRRARRLSRGQIEARMVPRTADTVSDDEAVHQRSMVVSAMRIDGENAGC